MTFWNIANGLDSDLCLEAAPSITRAVVPKLIALPVAAVTSAVSIAAVAGGYTGYGLLARTNYIVWRHAFGRLDELPATLTEHERQATECRQRRVQKAIGFYERARSKHPTSTTVVTALAGLYECSGDLARATEFWKVYTSIEPQNYRGWARLAMVQMTLGKFRDSADALAVALKLNPRDARLWENYGVVLKSADQPQEAKNAWQHAVALDPTSAVSRYNLGMLCWELGAKEEARRNWKQAHSLDPGILPPGLRECRVALEKLESGDLAAAMRAAEAALEFDPTLPGPEIVRARIFESQDRKDLALAAWDSVVSLDGANVVAWCRRGDLLEERGQHERARECWSRAFDLDKKAKVPWVKALEEAVQCLSATRAADALSLCDSAINLFPQYAEAWFRKAVALKVLGRRPEATSAFETALKYDPKHALAWFNLGEMFAHDVNEAEASNAFERATELNPALAQAWLLRGALLADSGELHRAVECFDRATSLGNDRAKVAAVAARAYLDLLEEI